MHLSTEPDQETPDPALVQAEINALQAQLVALDAELKRRELKIQKLTLELAYLKRVRFGCKSEALTSEQRDLFIETGDEDGAAIRLPQRRCAGSANCMPLKHWRVMAMSPPVSHCVSRNHCRSLPRCTTG